MSLDQTLFTVKPFGFALYYDNHVTPEKMYPLLQRMERNGWLRCVVAAKGGVHARKSYYLTDKGRDVLEIVLARLDELRSEVGRE